MKRPAEGAAVPVCYVIGTLEWCGTSVHLLAFLRELDRSRFDPWVVCLVDPGPAADAIRALGIRVDAYALRSGYSLEALSALARLAREIRRTRTRIVQGYLFLDNLYATFAGRAGGASAVITGRRTVDEWEKPHRRKAYRLTNRLVSRIAVVSDEVEASVLKWERPPEGKVRLIRNALSRDLLFARTDPADAAALDELEGRVAGGFLFGTVGNSRPIKGHDVLVEAFAPVAADYPDTHLVIVGDGPSRPDLERRIRALDLEGRVYLAGSRTNVAAFLERLDVFVLPSRAEGMSNALLEAMMLGKPSIATPFGLPKDAGGRAAVYPVEAGDPEALGRAMLALRGDAALREDLAGRASAFASTVMDVRRMAREYEALYDTLLRRAVKPEAVEVTR